MGYDVGGDIVTAADHTFRSAVKEASRLAAMWPNRQGNVRRGDRGNQRTGGNLEEVAKTLCRGDRRLRHRQPYRILPYSG
jgi:hypothetical protein